jgi:hypothetical protein
MGSPYLRTLAGTLVIELGAALSLQAGVAPLLLQASRGGHVSVSFGGLIRLGRFIIRGV